MEHLLREPRLNADPLVQLRLLDLQTLDSRGAQLAHRRRTLPEIAQLDALAAESTVVSDRLIAARTEASDVERQVSKAEADVEQVRQRAQRDKQRLEAGVGTAKDLQSLTTELESLARRQSELEDAELAIMERLEEIQTQVDALAAESQRLSAQAGELTATRDAAWAGIDAELAEIAEERALVVPDLPADLLALYEKLRDQYGGVGAAVLENGRCQGCRLELTTADLARIREEPPDAIVRCEECRRILVRRV